MDFFLKWITEIIVGVITAILLPVFILNLNKIKKWFGCCGRIKSATKAVSQSGRGLWLSAHPNPPKNYRSQMHRSIPILTIANLKGGVGKTTLAANLTASYAAQAKANNDKPVLAIDLDFQGSLSSMMLADSIRWSSSGDLSKSAKLISGNKNGLWLTGEAVPVINVDHAWCIPAYYDLASVENRLMVEWLIGEEKKDIRYNLAEILLDPNVQEKFSRIIIDAPPRLTTSTIQALCASTQVLIPTKLDVLSAEAIGSFIVQLKHHTELYPELKIAGIAGTMNMSARVPGQAILAIEKALEQQGNPTHLLGVETFIPHRALFGIAAGQTPGKRIVYANSSAAKAYQTIREDFDRLRDAI